MRCEGEIRSTLIDNTIHLIAEGGFEKATTRNITRYSPPTDQYTLNEAYIYRLFGSKEALYASAFLLLDTELVTSLCRKMENLHFSAGPNRAAFEALFQSAWRFLLRNEMKCRCYTRYYYSIYFKEASQRKHRAAFEMIVNQLAPAFKPEANVTAIMHGVLTMMLDYAIQVYNGDLENTENNATHVFNVLYCVIATYLVSND